MTSIDQPFENRSVSPPTQPPRPTEVVLNDRVLELLRQTKPWVRFLSVMGFIICGLMLLTGLGTGLTGVSTGRPEMIGMGILYPIMSILYIFPSLFLFRYASCIGDFLISRRGGAFEGAIEAQKSFWKFVGILMLVMLGLYAVLLAFLLVAAILSAA